MANDPTNASLYSDADVYVAPTGSPLPATAAAAFSGAWSMAGLLDGEAGFALAQTVTKNNFHAWSGGVYKISRKDDLMEMKFVVLEDNPVTRAIIWPGSSAGTIARRAPANVMLAFETREGGKVHRYVTRNYAQVDLDGPISMNSTDPVKYNLVATVFPDANGIYFDEQSKPSVASVAITPLTLALATAAKNVGKLVATATYTDATTADVSGLVVWTSAAPTKATVDVGGYVTAVSAGTSNVSCAYDGVTSTAPCAVTVT